MEKTRDYLFDNYKAFLIYLVVLGHFVGPSVGANLFLRLLKWVIVSFHMPAFIFISGYFSKKELSVLTILQRLAVPYLVYEVIYYLWYTFVTHKATTLSLMKPKFTLWYLLALFMWRLITPYVKKLPYHTALAVLAGILIGFSNMEDSFLTIPRALVYYPFYLAGTSFDRETLIRWRTKKGTVFSLGCLLLMVLLVCCIGFGKFAPMQIFYGRYNYVFMKQGMLAGVLWRTVLYLIGFGMTFSLLVLIPEKKLFLSFIGTRTMAIYLFHGLTYTYLEQCTHVLEKLNTLTETLLLLIGCAGITLLFSWKPFTAFTTIFSNLKIFHHLKGTAK